MEQKHRTSKYIPAAFALALGCSIGWGCLLMPQTTLSRTDGAYGPLIGSILAAGAYGPLFGMLLAAGASLILYINFKCLMNAFPDAEWGPYQLIRQAFGMDHAYFAAWSLLPACIGLLYASATAMVLLGHFLIGGKFLPYIPYMLSGHEVVLGDIVFSACMLIVATLSVLRGYRFALRITAALYAIFMLCVAAIWIGAFFNMGNIFLYIGLFCALLGSMIGFFVVIAHTLAAMAEDHIVPGFFSKTNNAGVPCHSLSMLLPVALVILCTGKDTPGPGVGISMPALAIVYCYVSLGTLRYSKKNFLYQICGLVGAFLSFAMFLLAITPNTLKKNLLGVESCLVLSLWCLIGLVHYRTILLADKDMRLGKSRSMWLLMFFLMFYSALLWSRKITEQDIFLAENKNEISDILTSGSLILTLVMIVTLIILFELFGILLRRQQELEKKIEAARKQDNEKNSLLSSMSHNIRTPLNAIIGFTDLALQDSSNSQRLMEHLDQIRVSGDHLLSLLDDMLEMNYMETKGLVPRSETINLPKFLNKLTSLVYSRVTYKNHTLHLDVSPIYDENVICDRDSLYRALSNLTTAIIMNSPDGGKIDVNVLQLMPAENGRAIYEFSLKNSALPDAQFLQEGTGDGGLGMAIASRIIDMMDGQMEITANCEDGTEIFVTFEFEISQTDEASAPTVDLAGKRALIVDDIMINRMIVAEILEMYEIQSEEADNGEEAVEMLRNSAPGYYDFVLTDIQMPKMDGFEATREIRRLKDPVNSSIPILALTANVFDKDRAKAFESGIDDFLPKPVDRTLLIKKLTAILVNREHSF